MAIVCASGIATTVYEGLCANVSTLHSFYGLGTADLPWQMVVSRSLENSLCVERVKGTDCVIWDEASMSSRRIFELINQIHPAPRGYSGCFARS